LCFCYQKSPKGNELFLLRGRGRLGSSTQSLALLSSSWRCLLLDGPTSKKGAYRADGTHVATYERSSTCIVDRKIKFIPSFTDTSRFILNSAYRFLDFLCTDARATHKDD
jgi:hypothetical protein